MPVADILEPLNRGVFSIAGHPTSWAELLGNIAGLACVALAVRRRVENFPIGIANNLLFIALFFDARLYADTTLQVIFGVLGAHGWYVWATGKARPQKPITDAPSWVLGAVAGGIVVATLILMPVLRAAHGAAPFWDASITAGSLGAQLLLNLRYVQNWWIWIAVDVISVPVYTSRHLYLTAALYVVFMGLCVRGWLAWRATKTTTKPALVTA